MRRLLIPTLAFLASSLAFVLAQAQHQDDPVVLRLGQQTETLSEFESRFEIAIRSVVASRGMEMTDDVRAQLEKVGFVPLDWDHTDYEAIVGPVAGQLSEMGNALKWEEEQLKKLN